MYGRICENCGAILDPGEKCDCNERTERLADFWQGVTEQGPDGQIIFRRENNEGKQQHGQIND